MSEEVSNTKRPSSLQWKESNTKDGKTLTKVLFSLQRDLRSVHKRKVAWPAEELISSHLSPSKYLMALLQPIADLFNQLHSPSVLETPMECTYLTFGDFIHQATFALDDFKIRSITAPIVLSLPDNLFDSKGKVSSRVEYSLSKALEYKPSAPSLIVTNFKDIAVFSPPSRRRPEPTFERISTTQSSLALRVISTAYLHNALLVGLYINIPGLDIEVDEDLILPEGPPQDPNQPLLADKLEFATCHRRSNFDLATVVRDRARALQFFRCHEYVQHKYFKVIAHPNDTLPVVTNKVG